MHPYDRLSWTGLGAQAVAMLRSPDRSGRGEMRMLLRTVGRVLMAGLVVALATGPSARAGEPGELTVMTSVALTSALDELKPAFENREKVTLAITYGLIADLK